MTTATTTGAPGRRERNKAEKRARILAAATRLLAERGYDGMAMAQVARDADVAIGTVFQYAATKPELLMMVAADRWGQVLSQVRPVGTGPVEQVMSLLQPVADHARREPEVAMAVARELMFGAPGEHRSAVVEVVAGLEATVARVLREAGAVRDVEGAARLVVSGGLLEVNRSRTGRAPLESITDRLRSMVEVVVAGATRHDRPS